MCSGGADGDASPLGERPVDLEAEGQTVSGGAEVEPVDAPATGGAEVQLPGRADGDVALLGPDGFDIAERQ